MIVIARTYNAKNYWLAMAAIVFGIAIGGCGPTTPLAGNSDRKPKVVSTSTMIADWTVRVSGSEIQHKGILKPGTDPHVYEPVPSDSSALEQADLIFYNGYNLEPGLIKLMNASGLKARKVAIGELVQPLELNEKQKGIVPDPHVWGDVKNAIAMVNGIRDELIRVSPEDKEIFRQNAAQLKAELQQLDTWIAQQIRTIPEGQRKLVTTHDAFQYYSKAYGIPVAGTLIGISTEEQPSAQTVKNLAANIKAIGVPAIFAETTINPALIKTVAAEAGVKLAPKELYSDSLGAPGSEGDTYIKMQIANTKAIVRALGGSYTEYQAKKTSAEKK